jgi:hydroxyacylglutathione hydrolase
LKRASILYTSAAKILRKKSIFKLYENHFIFAVGSALLILTACKDGTPQRSLSENGPVETGSLDVEWIHGSDPCSSNTDPKFQVYRYSENTYILRQNKCISRHSPFSYLLFGEKRAILFDTGAVPDASENAEIKEENGLKEIVDGILAAWGAEHGKQPPELTVAHFHNHVDHLYADPQFKADDTAVVVGTGPIAVSEFFGISDWPNSTATFDLGNRELIVIPIPGHTEDSITVYDPWTQFMLTGDSVYPGYIFVPDWDSFKKSMSRLGTFAETHQVSYILGTHIEMTTTPGEGYGGTYVENEHVLQLNTGHLRELNDSLEELGDTPAEMIHDDFLIVPRTFGPEAFGGN